MHFTIVQRFGNVFLSHLAAPGQARHCSRDPYHAVKVPRGNRKSRRGLAKQRLRSRVRGAEAEMRVEKGAIVLEKPASAPRSGWAEASVRLAASSGDGLVWPDFRNEGDEDLQW